MEKLSASHFGKKSLFNIQVTGKATAEKKSKSTKTKNILTLYVFVTKYEIACQYFLSNV
jgi:hypothetical protein